MNLNDLKIFAAIAQAGSMTTAARQLRVTQPAVSKRLAELEADLGMPLFDRVPRGVRLTPAGQTLLPHAQRILSMADAAEMELQDLGSLGTGRLSIGASTTIGSYLIPQLFGRFHRLYPGVALELEIGNTARIQSAVLDDRLDMGLTEGFVISDALDVEAVAEDDMVVIVAPGHPMLAQPPVRAANLAEHPLLMREPGSGTRDVIEAALAQRGITLSPAMSLGSTEALKNAVAAGLGVAIVSRLTVELELSTGRLAELPVTDLAIRRALHLLQLRGKTPSPAMTAFVQLLHQAPPQSGGYFI
ncbi:MAG: LysR family transcriptional regulator [Myxococcales bacterium]|nr:LysR family transcriptional regulator [Myxococcales bacterium]